MGTMFLATVIGWYLVIVGVFLLLRRELAAGVIGEITSQRGLFFVLAIVTIILGLLLVLSHNLWVMGWPVVITVFGWLVLVGGLIRLFLPDTAADMSKWFVNGAARLTVAGVIVLFIGFYLLLNVYYLA